MKHQTTAFEWQMRTERRHPPRKCHLALLSSHRTAHCCPRPSLFINTEIVFGYFPCLPALDRKILSSTVNAKFIGIFHKKYHDMWSPDSFVILNHCLALLSVSSDRTFSRQKKFRICCQLAETTLDAFEANDLIWTLRISNSISLVCFNLGKN